MEFGDENTIRFNPANDFRKSPTNDGSLVAKIILTFGYGHSVTLTLPRTVIDGLDDFATVALCTNRGLIHVLI